MVTRLLSLSIVVFLVLFIYVSYLNPLDVKFQYFKETYVETSVSILLISSFFLGGLITFLFCQVKDIRNAVRERRDKKEQQQRWERFYVATNTLFKGDLRKAEKQFLAYLKKWPDDPAGYLKLAQMYTRAGSPQEAIGTLRKAKDLRRDQLEILFAEAQIYKDTQDYPRAIRALQEIITLHPANLEAMRELRDIYINKREWHQALELQTKIVKRGPKGKMGQEMALQQGLRYEHARFAAEKGETEKGMRELREIVKDEGSFAPPQVLLGELLYRGGDIKEATKVWQKGFEETHEIIFLNKLENFYLSQEDPRGIIHLYLEAMEKNPDNTVIPFCYARLCLRLEMIDEALGKLKEMETILSKHPLYHYLTAEVYSRRGDYKQAAEEYQRGLELEGGVYLPHRCTSCQTEVKDWFPLCPKCGQWGTFAVSIHEESRQPAPLSLLR